ncbi:hypothetical protein St703_18500 [Sporolactobacillus terrae]|uniref:HicB-like antitoxin of toxin-antitoxin system domain-containing protein n=1 Tax=Sporolactobacillus terrae TaxID=269673 RepID=A0A5K7WX31_9BACL|nr:hypothetical protein St703_18500 [Sporolactobacillus terrae]
MCRIFFVVLEEDGSIIPAPSNPSTIKAPEGGFFILVEAWTDIIRDEVQNKAIKKTLTIPKWLNDEAERNKINFSQLLQFAIKELLGIKRP